MEVKSFIGTSVTNDLENALGQYILYQDVLLRTEPDRYLYLAVHEEAFFKAFDDSLGRLLLENKRIQVVVFDPDTEVILRWIP